MVFPADTEIATRGTAEKGHVYLILKGSIIEKWGEKEIPGCQMVLHEGEIAGLQNLLPKYANHPISNIYTGPNSMASVLQLNVCKLSEEMDDPLIRRSFWKRVVHRLIMLTPAVFPKLTTLDYRSLRRLISSGKIEMPVFGSRIETPGGAILLMGQLGKLSSMENKSPLVANKLMKKTTIDAVDNVLFRK